MAEDNGEDPLRLLIPVRDLNKQLVAGRHQCEATETKTDSHPNRVYSGQFIHKMKGYDNTLQIRKTVHSNPFQVTQPFT